MATKTCFAFAAVLAVSAAPRTVQAQGSVTHASLTGRVTDPMHAVVPRGRVEAVALGTGQSVGATTDAQGRYRFSLLLPGTYRVTANAPGFAPQSREVELTAGSAFDLTLEVGLAVTHNTVEVSATAPMALEADRSQMGETLRAEEAEKLSFNGRNAFDLALLLPGVSPTNTNSTQTFAETSPVIGQGYSVNSQRNFSNSFVVDGLSANDDAAGLAGNFYGFDVVQEFQVVTSGGQAEFGRALGGYFNLTTRSGTNALHGTAYGFLRNQRLNARNPLSQSLVPQTQGQFGASLSGPLHHDRSFFFGNYEGRRLNSNGLIAISPLNAAAVNAKLDSVGFTGPRLAVGSSPTTLFPTTVHTDNAFVRGDQHFRNGDQLSVRYSLYRLQGRNARGAGGLADTSYGTAVNDLNHTIALGNVAGLSPRLFNETRAQFTFDSLQAPPNTDTSPAVIISGVATFGRFSSSPTARRNLGWEAVDNVVLERGTHMLKGGGDFLYNSDTITFPQTLRGSYTFASLTAFQAGTYTNGGFSQSFGTPVVHQGNPNLGIYLQDQWKVGRGLTLNGGVRYDLQFLRTIATDTNNVAPRLGFAWSPGAQSRTVVRGSFGLFYDRVPLRALANALLSANNTTDPAQGRLLSYTYSPQTPGAPRFPGTAALPPPGALLNFALMDPHLQNAYAAQASLGVEQQLPGAGVLGLSFQHVRGLHLLSSYNTNINRDGTRPDPTRGNIKPYVSRFDSTFDGLEVSWRQRPAPWLSTRVSYTWSKAIDNVGEFFFSSPLNNFDFGVDRSRSDDDQRHRLVLDAVLRSPSLSGDGVARRLARGWQLSGFLQFYSRLPFNIVTGANTLQQTGARPCMPSAYGTAACAQALRGAVIGRNAGVGFDYFMLNPRLSRRFALREKLELEALAEAFNALNHRNNAVPNGTFGAGRFDLPPTNASFGAPTAVFDPRGVQLALRLSF